MPSLREIVQAMLPAPARFVVLGELITQSLALQSFVFQPDSTKARASFNQLSDEEETESSRSTVADQGCQVLAPAKKSIPLKI